MVTIKLTSKPHDGREVNFSESSVAHRNLIAIDISNNTSVVPLYHEFLFFHELSDSSVCTCVSAEPGSLWYCKCIVSASKIFCHIYNGKCVSLAQFLNLLSLSASLPILLIYSKKRVIVCISFPRESRNFTSKIVWLVIFHSDIGYVTLSFFETQKKCYKESIHLFCWPRWKILTILSFPRYLLFMPAGIDVREI